MPPEQRWEELRRERDEAKRLYHELASRPAPVAAPAAPQADPWEGLINHPDPATAQFYLQQKRLVDHALTQREQAVRQEVAAEVGGLKAEVARLNTERFREKHPDIRPGSEEERLIVAYMNGQVDGVRHPLESAKRNALYDRLEADNRALKAKQAATTQKAAAANIEPTAGIPAASGLPRQPESWRERVGAVVDQGGGMLDAAKAIFGPRKPA